MQEMEKAIYELLNGKINYNNAEVPVLVRYYPIDKKPCITISQTSAEDKHLPHIGQYNLKLPESHPQYDKNNPDKLAPQQVRRDQYNAILQINIWCNTEEERTSIYDQIRLQFYYLLNHHYTQCCNYAKGKCTANNNIDCYSLTTTNSHSVKGQCPKPSTYGYTGIMMKYYIHPASVMIDPGFNQDELDPEPPLLRTIIKVNMEYFVYFTIGGITSTDIKLKY